jgi:hypothetical protein
MSHPLPAGLQSGMAAVAAQLFGLYSATVACAVQGMTSQVRGRGLYTKDPVMQSFTPAYQFHDKQHVLGIQ